MKAIQTPDLIMIRFEINVCGITGVIYQTAKFEDRYSLQCSGFYNWHCSLKECIEKSEVQMKRIAGVRIEKEFKDLKRKINKANKA